MDNQKKQEIINFIKDSVNTLLNSDVTNCRYKLDDRLAVFVGWSAGYGKKIRTDVVQCPTDPDWAINVGIKVWTSDDMWTDFDLLNFPYEENGDIYINAVSIEPDENYELLGDTIENWYADLENLILDKKGLVIGKEAEDEEE